MMKRVIHLLGGVHFAIALIAASAALVIVGTFLESQTDSHLYAARIIYNGTLFTTLLWLFFVNILFAALKRWPFKRRQIPFLLTHLGLLMMILGVIFKNRYGLQGNMEIWEGSGSQNVLLPHTHALVLETLTNKFHLPLDESQAGITSPIPELKIRVMGSVPHLEQTWETWIKGDLAWIIGSPPFPVYSWSKGEPLPPVSEMFHPLVAKVLALRTADMQEAVREVYLSHQTPLLLMVEDENREAFLFAFDNAGDVWGEKFSREALKSLVSYDQGRGGYAVQSSPPLGDHHVSIETPLTFRHRARPPLQKEEDNQFGALIELEEAGKKQLLWVMEDRSRFVLPRSVLDGKYLVSLQTQRVQIPHRLRLREARQINYPHSNQPYSYEATLLLSENGEALKPITLSMNQVYETSDGYRFYLAGMSTPGDEHAKKVQIVVNHDPVKYILTYPGAFVLSLGTILLLWLKRKR